jgi:hypothetical protein
MIADQQKTPNTPSLGGGRKKNSSSPTWRLDLLRFLGHLDGDYIYNTAAPQIDMFNNCEMSREIAANGKGFVNKSATPSLVEMYLSLRVLSSVSSRM